MRGAARNQAAEMLTVNTSTKATLYALKGSLLLLEPKFNFNEAIDISPSARFCRELLFFYFLSRLPAALLYTCVCSETRWRGDRCRDSFVVFMFRGSCEVGFVLFFLGRVGFFV